MATVTYTEEVCRILELAVEDLHSIENLQVSSSESGTPRSSATKTGHHVLDDARRRRIEFATFALAHLIHIDLLRRWRDDSLVTLDAMLERDSDGAFLALDPAYISGLTRLVVRRAEVALEAAAASRRESQAVSASSDVFAAAAGTATGGSSASEYVSREQHDALADTARNQEAQIGELLAELRRLQQQQVETQQQFLALLSERQHAEQESRTLIAHTVQLEAIQEFLAPFVQKRQLEWQTQHDAWLVKQEAAREVRRQQAQTRRFPLLLSSTLHGKGVTVEEPGLKARARSWGGPLRASTPLPPRYVIRRLSPCWLCLSALSLPTGVNSSFLVYLSLYNESPLFIPCVLICMYLCSVQRAVLLGDDVQSS